MANNIHCDDWRLKLSGRSICKMRRVTKNSMGRPEKLTELTDFINALKEEFPKPEE